MSPYIYMVVSQCTLHPCLHSIIHVLITNVPMPPYMFLPQCTHVMYIFVTDDLDISPDFFEYFAATFRILQRDPTLWCVSAWNDNGKANMVEDAPGQCYLFIHECFFASFPPTLDRQKLFFLVKSFIFAQICRFTFGFMSSARFSGLRFLAND